MKKICPERQPNWVGNNVLKPTPKVSDIPAHSVPEDSQGETDSQEKMAQSFSRSLAEDGKRPKTIESYAGDVTGFLQYLRQAGTDFAGNLKRFQITGYRNHLVEKGYEASTVNKKINSLQSFNRWLVDTGLTPETVVDLRKDRVKVVSGSEKQVEVFSERQLERLLFHVQGEKATLRDRAVVLTLLYTGVRVSELCDIKVKNIDFLTGHAKITGKGGQVREVPLKPEVIDAIREYLTVRAKSKHSGSEYLFLGQGEKSINS